MAKYNCDDCFYWRKLNSGEQRYCAYMFITDRRRPCPPGDGCTVKIPIKVKWRKARKDNG